MYLPSKLKRVFRDLSGVALDDLVEPPLFQDSKELTGTNKAAAVLECRCFTEAPVDPHRCTTMITKVLYLMCQGEEFTPAEKSEIFFSSTRLLQCTYPHLRRLVHLLIKTLQPPPDEAFVVTSTLSKDIASNNDLYRANAFRTIVRVVDPQTACLLERFIKSAIVDRNPHISSTALLCALHMASTKPDLVRRWIGEVTECISSKHSMVQFHALAVLYEIKKHDKLALHRILVNLSTKVAKSPLTECLLVRYGTQLLSHNTIASQVGSLKSLFEYFETTLDHRSDVVGFETAKTFLEFALNHPRMRALPDESLEELISPYLMTLKLFLCSTESVVRFAAMRILCKLAQKAPKMVARCVQDIEPLITDSSRSVSVLALITLLRTGYDEPIDKLLKQFSSVMAGISESQRIEVVSALKTMCVQHPSKVSSIVTFLAGQLREDGGTASKAHTVDTLCFLATEMSFIHSTVLLHLCDFIEDCEYHALGCRILTFLAEEVPKTQDPRRYIRYIYNRIILENAVVRAAAVDCLLRIGKSSQKARPDAFVLLNSGWSGDCEDEIRERLAVSLKKLAPVDDTSSSTIDTETDRLEDFLDKEITETICVDALVERLELIEKEQKWNEVLDMNTIPTVDEYLADLSGKQAALEAEEEALNTVEIETPKTSTENVSAEDDFLKLTDDDLEKLHHKSKSTFLTEQEAEYVVQLTKYFWNNLLYIGLEFTVRNTLESQTLSNVQIKFKSEGCPYDTIRATTISSLKYDVQDNILVLLKRKSGLSDHQVAAFQAQLTYSFCEGRDDIEYDDTYEMENIVISCGDFVSPISLASRDFGKYWNLIGESNEKVLPMAFGHLKGGVPAAVQKIVNTVNMHQCEGDESGPQEKIFLSGRLVGNSEMVLVQGALVISAQHGILAKIQIRSLSSVVADYILEGLSNIC